MYLLNMIQQLHVAGLPQATDDGYFDTANANKSWVRVHWGQSSEFPIYPTTLERTINSSCTTYVTMHNLRHHAQLTSPCTNYNTCSYIFAVVLCVIYNNIQGLPISTLKAFWSSSRFKGYCRQCSWLTHLKA